METGNPPPATELGWLMVTGTDNVVVLRTVKKKKREEKMRNGKCAVIHDTGTENEEASVSMEVFTSCLPGF